ncbi:MAG: anthranilate phosphoribosyltransferase [Candidatus Dormibacteria bacterium]
MIREAVLKLTSGVDLDRDEAAAAMDEMMTGEATPGQVGGFLVALRMKGETVDEIVGLVSSMREHALRISAPPGAIDTCGTGGDRSGTFNISTVAALVLRGAGAVVAKHGNRAASSLCGSADVLESLGVAVNLGPVQVEECLRRAGIGFLFALTFHPAMRHVAGVRRDLGIRTVFNLLGPLANPAGVRRQAIGVGAPGAAERMVRVLAALGHERALVFYGNDGLDELSTTGPSHVYDLDAGRVTEYDLDPASLGLRPANLDQLRGGDVAENTQIVRALLGGEKGPRRDIVLLNAAAGAVVAGLADDLAGGLQVASRSLDNGSALRALEIMVATSQELSG